jgi:hypothetical protein
MTAWEHEPNGIKIVRGDCVVVVEDSRTHGTDVNIIIYTRDELVELWSKKFNLKELYDEEMRRPVT